MRNSSNDIWVASSDCSNAKRLTFDNHNFEASWSPDKSKIVFNGQRDGGNGKYWAIYTMNADGSGETLLTKYSDTTEFDPTWSPDGSRIAFAAWYPDQEWVQIYTERPDGTDRQQVTKGAGIKYEPQFSPDGKKVLFVSDLDKDQGVPYASVEQRGIFVVDVDGTNLQKLTRNAQTNFYPVWSPDGSMIAFTYFEPWSPVYPRPDWQYWVMNADGGNAHLIRRIDGQLDTTVRMLVAWHGSQLLVEQQINDKWVPNLLSLDGSTLTPISSFETSGTDDEATDWR
jgi:Tol biopolymer transport system component